MDDEDEVLASADEAVEDVTVEGSNRRIVKLAEETINRIAAGEAS